MEATISGATVDASEDGCTQLSRRRHLLQSSEAELDFTVTVEGSDALTTTADSVSTVVETAVTTGSFTTELQAAAAVADVTTLDSVSTVGVAVVFSPSFPPTARPSPRPSPRPTNHPTYPIGDDDQATRHPTPRPTPGPTVVPTPMPTLVTCTNDVMGETETDVDCGGPDCPPCELGSSCEIDTDCQTSACLSLVCVLAPTSAPTPSPTPEPTTPAPTPSSDSSNETLALILLIVILVAVVAFCGLILVAVICCYFSKKGATVAPQAAQAVSVPMPMQAAPIQLQATSVSQSKLNVQPQVLVPQQGSFRQTPVVLAPQPANVQQPMVLAPQQPMVLAPQPANVQQPVVLAPQPANVHAL